MIVGSVLLVLVAGVLLGVGLVRLDEPLLYSSIGVSALAALMLVVGVRRLAALRAGRGVIAVRRLVADGRSAEALSRPVGRATPRPTGRARVSPPPHGHRVAPGELDAQDPPAPADEPGPEPVAEADLAQIGRLDAEVVVVDGRPRFHLADCRHLLGLEGEPVTAAVAVEFGFTPCGLCRPASALLSASDGDAGAPNART